MTKEDLRERLRSLVGNRLADKMIADVLRANVDLSKMVLKATLKSVDDRMGLAADDLIEGRFNDVREEALACIRHLMVTAALCDSLSLCCLIAHGQEQPMAVFITHAIEHYTTELETVHEKPDEDVVVMLRKRSEQIGDKKLEQMAKAHSSNN